MVHESIKSLRFDRRLQGRRGWANEEAFEAHLEALPDVSEKAEMVAGDAGAASTARSAPEGPSAGGA